MSALALSTPVRAALADGRPVVALESTLIAHGLPRPRGRQVALELEDVVTSLGGTPATIGVVDGEPIVGLDAKQLDRIAGDEGVLKASSRDLPVVIAAGATAATTVASTALLAARAGIRVFATGGLGGVHRGANETYDESADLVALSRLPITVVSAGVKSILDVGATLERLETHDVTVLGYQTDRFPGFYLADSGHPLDWRVESAAEVADVMAAADGLGRTGAIVVANPIPVGRQLDPEVHDRVLASGLAAAAGITGKAVTPFLLDHFHRETRGASMDLNVDIVLNNAHLASLVAAAWAARAR